MRIERITADDIKIVHHKKLLDLRNQERLINSEMFMVAWTKATKEQRKEVFRYFKRIQPDSIREWANLIYSGEYESLTARELRRIASRLHIPNYSRMWKEELIKAIKTKKEGK